MSRVTTYTTGEVVALMCLAFVLAAALMFATMRDEAGAAEVRMGKCHAPCVVRFGPNMQEDEFGIDYVHGTLIVTRVAP